MATTIKLKNGSGAPLAGDLVQGEPALDLTNKRLYTEDSGGTVIEVGTNPTSLTTTTVSATGSVTGQKLVASDGLLELDDNGTHNGIINVPASLFINIDSDNTATTEDFVIAKDRTSTSGGTELFRVQEDGNVGIGTASPASKLHVKITTNENVRITGGSGDTRIIALNYAASATTQFSVQGDPLIFRTSGGAEMARIDSSGNLGLGTTAPSSYGGGFVVDDLGINIVAPSSGAPGTNKLSWWSDNNGISQNAYISVVNDGATTNTGEMVFYTKNPSATLAERMRINSSGDFLINTTVGIGSSSNTANNFTFAPGSGYAWFSVSNPGGIYIQRQNDGSVLTFYRATAAVGSITVDASAPTTNYLTTSDARVKENIVDAPAGNIDAIRVRSFDWKDGGSHQKYGMVAQELVDVAPEAVSQGETEEDMWGVDYSKLVPMMIKEIQDLKAEVAALKGA